MAKKRVYTFGNGHAEGNADMRNLLGGKGANCAEMNLIGVPVPPGFTITTDVCNEYYFKGELIKNVLPSYKILIDNFPGGNSSEDINLSKDNAITTMENLLNVY